MKRFFKNKPFVYFVAVTAALTTMSGAVAHDPMDWNGDKIHVVVTR